MSVSDLDFDARVRRSAVPLFDVAIVSTWLYANLPLELGAVNRFALNLILVPAFLSLIVVWYFPWHRFHRLAFLAITASALTLIVLAVAFSGGWHSPLIILYFLAVLFNAAYYPRRLALVLDCLVVLCSLSPAWYAPTLHPLLAHLVLFGPACLCVGAVADLLIRQARRWEREASTLVARQEQRQRELARLTALHRAGMAVSAELDPQRVMETVIHELAVSLGYRFVGIYMCEGDMHCLRAQVGYTAPVGRIGLHEGVMGRVYRGGRGVLVEDVRADPDYRPAAPTVRSEVGVPILRDRTVIGVVNVESDDALNGDDLELLELFAQQISTALANAETHAAMTTAARHDPLTGVLNREALMAALSQQLYPARSSDDPFALLFLDFDRFKTVNDSLGHLQGDHLLITASRRLLGCLGPDDVLARLGGDEFAVLLKVIPDAEYARTTARCMQAALAVPIVLAGHEVVVNASIGITLGPAAYHHPEELLRDADTAMYRAKEAGMGLSVMFDSAMHARAVTLLEMEHELRHAVARGELVVSYQPIVALDTGNLLGFEALVRWHHPRLGLIMPSEFIPLAEETGVIISLDRWVLGTACRDLRAWQQRCPGAASLAISVNLSGRQFTDPDLPGVVHQALVAAGIAPRLLRLEITERVLVEYADAAVETLTRLRAMGVQMQIDDFGTGYSSLSQLRHLPLDALKIDRSFLGERSEDLEVVRAIISLGHNLGMRVVAEGIETPAQAARLRALGCDAGQGFWFTAPMMAAAVESFVADSLAPYPAPVDDAVTARPDAPGRPGPVVSLPTRTRRETNIPLAYYHVPMHRRGMMSRGGGRPARRCFVSLSPYIR